MVCCIMRVLAVLLALPILSGCDGPAAQRQLVMEEIERSVQLPKDAYPYGTMLVTILSQVRPR